MNLFVDYVQPLTTWLVDNPNWALFFTFIISLGESLAIVGSIIPGSLTMTAIGILAGSGIMRIDLTLLAATLGAIAGDSLSYALGYYYSERLVDMWPFYKYPTWLSYGKDFFQRHGGKSVLLGRFVGPLRSIIPVIAGIMHMKQWRFIVANVISAIIWSLLYIMPGILIGAATNELSAESSTRLIMFILLLIAGIWLTSLMIKWLLGKLNKYLKMNLHQRWQTFKHHPLLGNLFKLVTPKQEIYHYDTAVLVISTLLALVGFIIFFCLSVQVTWFPSYNLPLHLLMQGFLTPSLESFFIICTQLTSTGTILCTYLFICIWFLYNKCFRTIIYASSILFLSCLFALILAHLFPTPRPQGFIINNPGSSLPPINLLVATAFYGFIVFVIKEKYALMTNAFKISIVTILALSGLGAFYLGDYWCTDILTAYAAGISIYLLGAIFYRKTPTCTKKQDQTAVLIALILNVILLSSVFSSYFNFKTLRQNHIPYQKEYSLSDLNWWNQNKPILPLYLLNRIGQRLSLLNIQYSGDLDLLQDNLEQQGWKLHNESFFTKLIQRIGGTSNQVKLPLLDFLYENKHPELIMTYTKSNTILELRIWESQYYLRSLGRPVWIGSVQYNKNVFKKQRYKNLLTSNFIDPLTYVLPALNNFTVRRIQVPNQLIKPTNIPTSPYILLISAEPKS